MVTTFNPKDLVSFGNFLVSEERTNKLKEAYADDPVRLEQALHQVSLADVDNWKDQMDRLRAGTVRAKFECTFYEKGDESTTFHFSPALEGPENEEWSKYTPAGNLTMDISNSARAVDFFQSGQSYYLDFNKVLD